MVFEIWSTTDKFFLSFWVNFCPFTPLATQKIKILKKKTSEDTIILHKWNQKSWLYAILFLRYGTWQKYIFIFIFSYFLPFYPPNTSNNENFKKKRKKKGLEITSFYTRVPKIMIICYTVPKIWHKTNVIVVFHFGLFFALLPL